MEISAAPVFKACWMAAVSLAIPSPTAPYDLTLSDDPDAVVEEVVGDVAVVVGVVVAGLVVAAVVVGVDDVVGLVDADVVGDVVVSVVETG